MGESLPLESGDHEGRDHAVFFTTLSPVAKALNLFHEYLWSSWEAPDPLLHAEDTKGLMSGLTTR